MKKIWLLLFLSSFAWGAYSPGVFIADPTTTTQRAAVKAGSTAPGATDEALVVTLSPNSATPNTSVGANGSAAKTSSTLMGVSDGTNQEQLIAPISLGDGVNGNNSIAGVSYLYNGTTFDRARGDATNGAFVNVKTSVLPTGASTSALQTSGNTTLTAISGQLPAALDGANLKVHEEGAAGKTYPNAAAAFSQTSVTTTASTISAPSNAVRVVIQGDASNTDCIRYRFDGTAATASVGMVAQPGQDSGQLDSGMSVSVASCSGTQVVNVQYFAQ